MSVIMELCVFSISGSLSKSKEVKAILQAFDKRGIKYELNPMGTCVECKNMKKATKILRLASKSIDAQRFYIVAKFDCYKGRKKSMQDKVKSVKDDLSNVSEGS